MERERGRSGGEEKRRAEAICGKIDLVNKAVGVKRTTDVTD